MKDIEFIVLDGHNLGTTSGPYYDIDGLLTDNKQTLNELTFTDLFFPEEIILEELLVID